MEQNPNIEADSEQKAFMADIEVAFIKNDEKVDIEKNRISRVAVMRDYEARTIPVIVVSINVEQEMYADMVNARKTGKIYLKVSLSDANSDTSISEDFINDQFNYFLPSTNPNYTKTLDEANTNADSNYQLVHLGLMNMDLIDQMRCSFNGVFKNIDQNTLLYKAVEGTKIVMQEPTYNNLYETLIVPPIISRPRMIEFIFDLDPFYDTDYLYFIDFDRSYLLARDGTTIDSGDGSLEDIIIDIEDVTTQEAYNEGMEIKEGAYYFYINPANSNVAMDQGSEKIANVLIAMNEDGSEQIELDINRVEGADDKFIYQRTSNPILYKNAIESSFLTIELAKENIDSRFITPNKIINIKNYEEFQEYNGKYLLMYKHDIFAGKAGEFTVTTSIGLKKLGTIENIGDAGLSGATKKSMTSSTQIYKNTATRKTKSKRGSTVSS